MRAAGVNALLSFLMRSSVFRALVREQSSSSADYLYAAITEFYRTGSVNIKFPQSRPSVTPQAFDQHMQNCECVWFNWVRANKPQVSAEGLKLLDVGCGQGYSGHHFCSFGYKVTAVSGNPEELVECSLRGMETIQCEMHRIPRPAASFDAVLASHVLEHSVAPMLLLWELRRLLKPSGIMYVYLPLPIDAEPRRDFPDSYDEANDCYRIEADENAVGKIRELSYYTYGFTPHIFVLTYWQWRWLFKQTGFDHIASAIETPDGVMDPEKALAKLQNRPHHCNQLFILRRSETLPG